MSKKYQSDKVEVVDIVGGNYTTIDESGTILHNGASTVWEDANLDPTMLTGGGSLPTSINLDGTTIPVAAFRGTGTDEVSSTIEYPHKAKLNVGADTTTKVWFHIHSYPTTANTGNIVFKLEYTFTIRNQVVPASTTIQLIVPVSGVAWQMQTDEMPSLTAPNSLGQQLHFRFYRDGANVLDTYADNIAVSTIGFHYEIDAEGSKEKTSKF